MTDDSPVRISTDDSPVRISVDLDRPTYDGLRADCDAYAKSIGVARVAGADVIRTLLDELRRDQTLHKRVGDSLAKTRGRRRRHA